MLDEKIADTQTKAVLVSVMLKDDDERSVEASFDELEKLLETAGGETFARVTQARETPEPRTYIGSGKIDEIRSLCAVNGIGLVIFDGELTPSQIKNIEDDLGDVRVIDRTMLILDIFALHAVTSEGKLQVELAQLKYTAPRLIGKGTALSRQQGGNIAMRGPGETKLETDRRHLKRRIASLEAELQELEKNRLIQRSQRDRSGIVKVAIAGYTNAGKSTLLNYLTDAGILAENKLFATLDPTTRKFTLPKGVEILLTDTVGFIRNLPHNLVKAFKSTLDEVVCADIILLVADTSDPEHEAQVEVAENLIKELGAVNKPILYVYNKCDICGADIIDYVKRVPNEDILYVSVKNGFGIDRLIERLEELVMNGSSDVTLKIQNSEAAALNLVYRHSTVTDVQYGDEYITVSAIADSKAKGILKKYII